MSRSTELEVVRMTDEELVRAVYDTVCEVMEEQHELADRLYWLTMEAFERFAPDVERVVNIVDAYRQHDADSAENELDAWEQSFARRAALRAKFRAFYDNLEGRDDG